MADLLGIRDIGLRLNIPPSTVVYYRDRFHSFIPRVASHGRHPKYPEESLDVFRRIRRRFKQGWRAEAIADELAVLSLPAPAPEPTASSVSVPPQSDSQMDRIASALERIADAVGAGVPGDPGYDGMAESVNALRQELHRNLRQHAERLTRLEQLRETSAFGKDDLDSDRTSDMEALPLAVSYPPDRFLGIRDAMDLPVTLLTFKDLIQSNTADLRNVSFRWNRLGRLQRLNVTLEYPKPAATRRISMDVEGVETPRGNRVALLHAMSVDGRALARDDLLGMLKWMKEALARWAGSG